MSASVPVYERTDDEVRALARGAFASLFRTGTATAEGAQANQNVVFTSGADVIVGDGIEARPNGVYRLGVGTWHLEGITRPGNYANTGTFLVSQWFDVSAGQFFGAQAIYYPNANTSAFTHQPTFAATLTVPDGQTRDVAPRMQFAGTTYTLSEGRSYLTARRVA